MTSAKGQLGTPEEIVREALREPYEIRGDGGMDRRTAEQALAALGSIETAKARAVKRLREARDDLEAALTALSWDDDA